MHKNTTSTKTINNIFFSKTIFIFFIISVLLSSIPVYRAFYFDEFSRLLFVLAPITFYLAYRFSLNAHKRFIALIIIVIVLQTLIIRILFTNGLFTSFTTMWCFVIPVVIFSLHRKLGIVMLILNALFFFILFIFFRLGELSQFNVPVLTLTEESIHFITMVFLLFYSFKHINNVTNASETAQNEALSQKEKLVEQKNQFLSNISHELRTPLNGIQGILGLVEGKNEKEAVLLNHAKSASTTLNNIINDILTIQEINDDQYSLNREWVDIRVICHDIESLYNFVIDHTLLKLTILYDSTLPNELYLDIDKVKEVLKHIINNAVKFTSQGTIRINVSHQNDLLIITVSDTGVGIDEDMLNSLFTPLKQGDSSATKQYQGMGLGLSIVKQIMNKMTGMIEVKSKVGKGTSVTLNIPAQKQ